MPSPLQAATQQAAFASAPSVSSARVLLFSDLRKDGLIASRPITAGSTDGADGTDGTDGTDVIFTTRAQLDHSGPCAAFTRECDLDAQCPEECLRPPQPTGERPRISCLCAIRRDVIASTLRIQTQKRRELPYSNSAHSLRPMVQILS